LTTSTLAWPLASRETPRCGTVMAWLHRHFNPGPDKHARQQKFFGIGKLAAQQ
jgi:hypothetical protein